MGGCAILHSGGGGGPPYWGGVGRGRELGVGVGRLGGRHTCPWLCGRMGGLGRRTGEGGLMGVTTPSLGGIQVLVSVRYLCMLGVGGRIPRCGHT